MENDIIAISEKYEVHPTSDNQRWAIVNTQTGNVVYDDMLLNDALELAKDLSSR